MTNKITNGDYEFDEEIGQVKTVDYIDEVLQTIKLNLFARRGSFYPNKDFGSLLRAEELKNPKQEYALAYARQALDRLDGVYVKLAKIVDDEMIFDLTINDNERQVSIKLEENL